MEKEKYEKGYREAVADYSTESGIPLKEVYTPEDISHIDFEKDIGIPGKYPFTRGHHPRMYRGKLWNIRQVTGLSTPRQLNERFKFVMEHGSAALTCELDTPTYYGIEPDHPYASGLVGVTGVNLNTLEDMETLFDGIPLDEVSVAFSIAYPAIIQAYILVAKHQRCDIKKLRLVGGGLHYWSGAFYCAREQLLVDGHLSTVARWSNDFCEYALKSLPEFNMWLADSDVMVGRGANAIQEIASIIACRNELIKEMLRRGIDINTIGEKMTVNIAFCRDFFEDIAKTRAARRIWARTMKEEFGATNLDATRLRFHAIVSGEYYYRQQPQVNIVRGTLATLAAILSGCMGCQTAAYDEALSTPTEEAERVAIRTQQVIRYESGVPKVADPLGGSYYLEWLTTRIEEKINLLIHEIEDKGGWLNVVKSGWLLDKMRETFIDRQRDMEEGKFIAVGVNRYVINSEEDFHAKVYAPEKDHIERYIAHLKEFKRERDNNKVREVLEYVRHVAKDTSNNLVEPTFEAIEVGATFPEIIGTLRMIDGLKYDITGEQQHPFSP